MINRTSLSKFWHVFLRVSYFSCLIGASALSLYIPLESNRPQLLADYEVRCNYGSRETFYAIRDKSIPINLASPNDSNAELQQACGITYETAMSLLKKELSDNLAGRSVEASSLFEGNVVYYRDTGDIQRGLIDGLFAFLITLGFFEVIRRIYYRFVRKQVP